MSLRDRETHVLCLSESNDIVSPSPRPTRLRPDPDFRPTSGVPEVLLDTGVGVPTSPTPPRPGTPVGEEVGSRIQRST